MEQTCNGFWCSCANSGTSNQNSCGCQTQSCGCCQNNTADTCTCCQNNSTNNCGCSCCGSSLIQPRSC